MSANLSTEDEQFDLFIAKKQQEFDQILQSTKPLLAQLAAITKKHKKPVVDKLLLLYDNGSEV